MLQHKFERTKQATPASWRCLLPAAGLALALLAGCPGGGHGTQTTAKAASQTPAPAALVVWCDPALLKPLAALSPDFTTAQKLSVSLVPKTRAELLQAAQSETKPVLPDVLIIADPQVRVAVVKAGWIDEATARTFSGDRLVLIERQDGKFTIPTLFDIYRRAFQSFGLLSQDNIEGYYGQQALVTEGVHDRIKDKLKEYASLDELDRALKADEIQIALVLSSEAGSLKDVKPFFLIGEDLHEDIRYKAAVAAGSTHAKAALAYLLLLSETPAGQQKLAGYGLLDRETALQETK